MKIINILLKMENSILILLCSICGSIKKKISDMMLHIAVRIMDLSFMILKEY